VGPVAGSVSESARFVGEGCAAGGRSRCYSCALIPWTGLRVKSHGILGLVVLPRAAVRSAKHCVWLSIGARQRCFSEVRSRF